MSPSAHSLFGFAPIFRFPLVRTMPFPLLWEEPLDAAEDRSSLATVEAPLPPAREITLTDSSAGISLLQRELSRADREISPSHSFPPPQRGAPSASHQSGSEYPSYAMPPRPSPLSAYDSSPGHLQVKDQGLATPVVETVYSNSSSSTSRNQGHHPYGTAIDHPLPVDFL